MSNERTSWGKGHNVGRFTDASIITGSDVYAGVEQKPAPIVRADDAPRAVVIVDADDAGYVDPDGQGWPGHHGGGRQSLDDWQP